MNEIIIPAIAAIVAVPIGILLSNWYKRSKPWLGISSIDRDDSTLVEVSNDIIDIFYKSTYYNSRPLKSEEPLYKLRDKINEINEALETFKKTSNNIDVFINKVNSGINSEFEKRQILSELLSDDFFMNVLKYLNSTNNLPINSNTTNEAPNSSDIIFEVEKYEDVSDKEFGVILYGEKSRYYLTTRGRITEQALERTHKLGAIFSSFSLNEIMPILNKIKSYLNQEIQISLSLNDKLTSLIYSRRLMVKVKVSNVGGVPLHIEPYGFLKVNSTGKPISPMMLQASNYRTQEPGTEEFERMMQIVEGMANKMRIESSISPTDRRTAPEYIIVNPGTLVEIDLYTMNTSIDSQVISALESGILSSQVVLKQANKKKNNLIKSEFQTMGMTISDEKIKEMEQIAKRI